MHIVQQASATFRLTTHTACRLSTKCSKQTWLCASQDSTQAVKLWGEDALLDWPGAMQPVIHDRDAHMAQAIWAAAHGQCPCLHQMFVVEQHGYIASCVSVCTLMSLAHIRLEQFNIALQATMWPHRSWCLVLAHIIASKPQTCSMQQPS